MTWSTRFLPRAILAISIVSAAACASRTATTPTTASPAPTAAPAPPAPMAGHDMSAMAGHDMSAMASLAATAGPGYTVADVRFMQHMIGHHAQAILMSMKAPTNGATLNVQRLAQKIEISQRDEIVFMKRWLTERKQAVPTDSAALTMMMPGMLTPAQLQELYAARGPQFDRLFLTYMIEHHRGALAMVHELLKDGEAAQEPEIFRFATDVDTDQQAEIYVMQQLLETISSRGPQ